MKRLVAIVALVVALVVAGCGGDDEETTTSTTPLAAPPSAPSAAAPSAPGSLPQEFLDCMAERGFDVPATGGPPPALLADPEAQSAYQACAALLPGGFGSH